MLLEPAWGVLVLAELQHRSRSALGARQTARNADTCTAGNCRVCPSAWPCPVVTTIHALVKDPDREFVALVRRADDEG